MDAVAGDGKEADGTKYPESGGLGKVTPVTDLFAGVRALVSVVGEIP